MKIRQKLSASFQFSFQTFISLIQIKYLDIQRTNLRDRETFRNKSLTDSFKRKRRGGKKENRLQQFQYFAIL